MKQRSMFVFCLILGMAAYAAGQTRTVTNSDLERYRQSRLRAEQDYRDNYAKLGMPSPEELERRQEKSRVETEQLSARLRAERLEREKMQAERDAAEQLAAAVYLLSMRTSSPAYYEPPLIISSGYGRSRFFNRGFQYQQEGYYSGGQFWPTVRRPALRPIFGDSRWHRR
ncbi:MAG: hypothetical protein ABR530_07140 [Pyrinomonadaceae bacterium]